MNEMVTCSKCQNEFHEDHPWKMTVKANYVCEDCADEMPKVFVIDHEIEEKSFTAHGELNGEDIGTAYYENSACAMKRILEMIGKLWDCEDPVNRDID